MEPSWWHWQCRGRSTLQRMREEHGGPIYTSSDSGLTWAAANAPVARWFCVASSADGLKLAAGAFADQPGGGIYTSTDGGRNWMLTSAPAEGWTSIACSADGTRLVA